MSIRFEKLKEIRILVEEQTMSKWEQNAVFEYSEYICLVKRINGIVAQKTLVTELVRCKECTERDDDWCMYWQNVINPDDFCSYGERKESE